MRMTKNVLNGLTVALHYKEIKPHPERLSNIVGYANNYNWSGLEFPVAINPRVHTCLNSEVLSAD